jgi:PIN domain nuclease of toxin-antitoxin system
MRLLLDTHIFLWYITGDARVGSRIRQMIEHDLQIVTVDPILSKCPAKLLSPH